MIIEGNTMINKQTDESIKELRLPIIEEAVMVVQGYIEPQTDIDVTSEVSRLMESFDDA